MKLLITAIIITLLALYKIGSTAPVNQTYDTQTIVQSVPATQTWSYALAQRLGNEQPSGEIIAFVDAWIKAENTAAAFNPLATTQPMPNSADFNSAHVQDYTSVEQGLDATVLTLQSGYAGYADIREGIRTGDVQKAFDGLLASPWGSNAAVVAQLYNGDSTQAVSTNQSLRTQVVQLALSQVGKSYILGANGPNTFDCSGLVQWAYAQIGIDTGRTTFDQLPKLRSIEPDQLQPGDMVYFQYPWDQHTGILADVDGDGKWDLIQAAAPGLGVIVTSDVFNDPFYTNAIIGYRTAF